MDTAGFYAYLSADDQDHEAVARTFQTLVQSGAPMATTSYVVAETIGLLQHRLGLKMVSRFVEDLLPLVDVRWIGADEHVLAWALWSAVHKRSFTIVDAASAALMRRDRVRQIVTLDPEFGRLGLELLPAAQDRRH